MKGKIMKASAAVGVVLFVSFMASEESRATVQSADWGGATVTMVYPEKVTFNTAFDFSFGVDSSTMGVTDNDALAFLPSLTVSNTVLYSGATWSLALQSADPTWNLNYSGTLGDVWTPIASDAGGFRIDFQNPRMAGVYDPAVTWLWKDYADRANWTVSGLVIQADTNFSLRLDDYGYGSGPITQPVLVLDPPAAVAAVPEPGEMAMFAAGLPLLAWMVRRRRSRSLV